MGAMMMRVVMMMEMRAVMTQWGSRAIYDAVGIYYMNKKIKCKYFVNHHLQLY